MTYSNRQNRSRDASIMRDVLSGKTLEQSGEAYGLSRNRVRLLVREICMDLVRHHRVDGLMFSSAATLSSIRSDSDSWLRALPIWENFKTPNV